ncbi:MAG: phosphatase PAP2 family protein [Methanobacteriaceae archaeon]
MPILTALGEFGWIVLVMIMLIFGNKKTKHLATWAILTMFIVELIVFILKIIFGEPRPFNALPYVRVLSPTDGFSFPSGHSTVSFALSVLIGASYKVKTKLIKDKKGNPRQISSIYIFMIFAILVAFSRIYVGVHYPLDVLVGSTIGIIIGLIMLNIYRKDFKIKSDYLNKVINKFKDIFLHTHNSPMRNNKDNNNNNNTDTDTDTGTSTNNNDNNDNKDNSNNNE